MAWPTTGIELIYPIVPFSKTNRAVFRDGNGHYKPIVKYGATWKHEFCTLNFQVRYDSVSEAIDFLRTNKGQSVSYSISGVQMFIRSDETNNVYIISYTKITREKQFYSKFSVTFMRVP